MSYTNWLRRQVSDLEQEIRGHAVFESDAPATAAELGDLRAKIVIHRYLKQQLLRREAAVVDDECETQELTLVRAAYHP